MLDPVSKEFVLSVRVYFEDTDAGGVVYHASYLKFFERARTECLRLLGWNQGELLKNASCAFVVSDLSIQYKRPAKLDDILVIRTSLKELRRASFVFEQRAFRDDVLMTSAQVRVVCISPSTGRPLPIPEDMYKEIEQLTCAA